MPKLTEKSDQALRRSESGIERQNRQRMTEKPFRSEDAATNRKSLPSTDIPRLASEITSAARDRANQREDQQRPQVELKPAALAFGRLT